MKLYYAPGACSLADHIALEESGLPFDLEKVDLKAKTTESGGDYREVNPKGYVPALALDDGDVLTENIAILSYIAHEAGKLLPSGRDHWHTLETTAFVSTELHKNFKPFFSPDASDADRAAARDLIGARLKLLDDQLGDRDFIIGRDLSVADCYLFVMLMWAKTKASITVPSRLNIYFEGLKARDAFAKAVSDESLDMP